MHTKSRIVLLTIILASFLVVCSPGSGSWTDKFPQGYASLIQAQISNTDNPTHLKTIQLIINPKSVYRSDVPLDGLYSNTKDLLYNIVASDLLLAGYQVLTPAESQTRVANKLILKYKEDTLEGRWRLCIPDSLSEDCPIGKGTYIRCEVELKNSTTNADTKKIIYAYTPESTFDKLALYYGDNKNDSHMNFDNKNGDNMRRVVYFSAFDDFNKQLIELINSELAKK